MPVPGAAVRGACIRHPCKVREMKLREKLRTFMIGRYGPDGLGQFLNKAALVCILLSIFFRGGLFQLAFYGLFGWALFRMLSRNTAKRAQENAVYYALRQKFLAEVRQKRSEWSQRKTYRFFRCPQCGQKLRVPTGRGRISITCPKCHNEFVKKS